MKITTATRSHPGRRPYNQDVVLAHEIRLGRRRKGYLVLVADGMGGAAAGDVASSVASEAFCRAVDERLGGARPDASDVADALEGAYRRAHDAVVREAEKDIEKEGMGTTLVSIFLFGDRYIVANVGDSRAYLIDSGDITQISKDHSAVQEMIDRGTILPEHRESAPMAHALTRVLGDPDDPPEVDIFPEQGAYHLHPGQILLLCSDGLENGLEDDDIHELICGIPKLDNAAEALVRAAWHGGSTDNISLSLVESGRLSRRPDRIAMPAEIARERATVSKRRTSRLLPILAVALFLATVALGYATWQLWRQQGAYTPALPHIEEPESIPAQAVKESVQAGAEEVAIDSVSAIEEAEVANEGRMRKR